MIPSVAERVYLDYPQLFSTDYAEVGEANEGDDGLAAQLANAIEDADGDSTFDAVCVTPFGRQYYDCVLMSSRHSSDGSRLLVVNSFFAPLNNEETLRENAIIMLDVDDRTEMLHVNGGIC
jgi:polysaccharide pyruvyl transferase WcaK-like protein